MKTKEIVIGAMLTAFSILIPVAFGNYLRILIPPFSATLASHVPVMIAMMISPAVAIIVGVGSGLGFLLAYGAGPVGLMISARAFSHAIWAYTGAVMIRRGQSFGKAIAVTSVLHALLEALVVYLMFIIFGIPVTQGSGVSGESLTTLSVMGIILLGTLLHHVVDGIISITIVKALKIRGMK